MLLLTREKPIIRQHQRPKLEPCNEVVLLNEPGIDNLPFPVGIIEGDLLGVSFLS
jgi:hypothetical protein